MTVSRQPATHPLWWEALPDPPQTRPRLDRNLGVDVAIVGAGFTGLWAAYYLLQHDPALRIVIVERDHVGFGASGRNGGWCYDGFAAGPARVEAASDYQTACRWGAVLRDTVREVHRVIGREGIECDFTPAGGIEFIRNGGQRARAAAEVTEAHHYGWTPADIRMLSAGEATEIGRARGVLGGLWSTSTAAIHPALLASGLAAVVQRGGAQLFEGTAARQVQPGRVVTDGGEIAAATVVRATEGYTADIPGLKRLLAPLYSLMIATEPIPDADWDEIGLAHRELFGDLRHLVVYGQRTTDGRIAFGGRGAPYDFGSRIRRNPEFPRSAFAAVHAALVDLFPQVSDVPVTHQWGGVLGVTRDWFPTAGIDQQRTLAWAGGYVGSGVAASNLAGRTLADLVTGTDSELTGFPWVNRRVRKWEPEPLRWLEINAALQVMESADRVEGRRDRPARRAAWLWRIIE